MDTSKGLSRKRKRDVDSLAPIVQSHLVSVLVELWSWGLIQAAMMQKICQAAEQDGLQHPEIKMIASIGHRGKYSGTCRRDLVACLQNITLLQCIGTVLLPLKIGGRIGGSIVRASCNIVLPHVFFAHMYKWHNNLFSNKICGGARDNIQAFWTRMAGSKHYETCGIKDRENHKTHCIPISVHGDGIPVTAFGRGYQKSVDIYSWCSLLSIGKTVD
eukprot:11663369-Karenia_brevis.AAC.1